MASHDENDELERLAKEASDAVERLERLRKSLTRSIDEFHETLEHSRRLTRPPSDGGEDN